MYWRITHSASWINLTNRPMIFLVDEEKTRTIEVIICHWNMNKDQIVSFTITVTWSFDVTWEVYYIGRSGKKMDTFRKYIAKNYSNFTINYYTLMSNYFWYNEFYPSHLDSYIHRYCNLKMWGEKRSGPISSILIALHCIAIDHPLVWANSQSNGSNP